MASGAVLILAIVAVLVGLIIFGGHLLASPFIHSFTR